MKSNKKILLIRLGAIGDVVMTTIIPQSIKAKHPECEIHYLTNKGLVKLLNNSPYIDKIIPYKGNIVETIKTIFKERYDDILLLNFAIRSYILGLLAFPKKIIFKSNKGTSWIENYFYTGRKVYNDIQLPKKLCLINKNKDCTERVLKKINKYPKPHIVINPGNLNCQIRQGRVWNIEKWKELSNKLLKLYGGTIFVTGSLKERDYHLYLEHENIVILSGLMKLEETCVVLSNADLVISGDSGPVHIASAYNKKTISILGSTSPDKIKPYGKNGYSIEPQTNCRYCWKKKCKFLNKNGYSPCIESVEPDFVLNKILKNNLLQVPLML